MMRSIRVILTVILLAACSAATTTNQAAFNYFTDVYGDTGFVYVARTVDPVTKVMTTTLSYSFCVSTTQAACLEGSGVVPNGAFTGTLTGGTSAQTVKVVFDTTTGGFVNTLCSAPDQLGGCQQRTAATGGLISLSYTTHAGSVETFTDSDYRVDNYQVTVNTMNKSYQGPASVIGSVIGTAVSNNGASWQLATVSGTGKSKTQSHLLSALAPTTVKRLTVLDGLRGGGNR